MSSSRPSTPPRWPPSRPRRAQFEEGAEGNVTATEVYSNTRTLYVEPVTGVVIEGREQINSVYEAEGYAPIAKTVGEIGFDDETVAQNAKDWGAKAGLLSFIENWLLLVGLVLGSILVAIGAYLLLKPAKAAAPGTRQPADGSRGSPHLTPVGRCPPNTLVTATVPRAVAASAFRAPMAQATAGPGRRSTAATGGRPRR